MSWTLFQTWLESDIDQHCGLGEHAAINYPLAVALCFPQIPEIHLGPDTTVTTSHIRLVVICWSQMQPSQPLLVTITWAGLQEAKIRLGVGEYSVSQCRRQKIQEGIQVGNQCFSRRDFVLSFCGQNVLQFDFRFQQSALAFHLSFWNCKWQLIPLFFSPIIVSGRNQPVGRSSYSRTQLSCSFYGLLENL